MLLAVSEIKQNKLKFSLIVLSLTLMVFLLVSLSALGNGLILGMAGVVKSLNTDLIVFQKGSHLSLQRSNLNMSVQEKLEDIEGVDRVVPFGQFVVTLKEGKKTFDGALIPAAIDPMVNPALVDGRALTKEDENGVVVDHSVTKQGVKIGDEVSIEATGRKLKIIGFTRDRRLSMLPTVYMNVDMWQKVKFETVMKVTTGRAYEQKGTEFINAFLVKAKPGSDIEALKKRISDKVDGVEPATRDEAADAFPGMAPMVMVVVALEALAFIIGTVIVGIFFYILTLQKISQVGMLKAIGASSFYIFKDLVTQVCILTLFGLVLGTCLAYAASFAIPPTIVMDFTVSGIAPMLIGVFVMSFVGSLFSLRHIIKIDAIIAIGQNG